MTSLIPTSRSRSPRSRASSLSPTSSSSAPVPGSIEEMTKILLQQQQKPGYYAYTPSAVVGGGSSNNTSLQQPRLIDMKLLWKTPASFRNSSSSSKSILNKRNIAALDKALKHTASILTTISVGWRHDANCGLGVQRSHKSNSPHLFQLLKVLGRPNRMCLQLHTIELVLNHWVLYDLLLEVLINLTSSSQRNFSNSHHGVNNNKTIASPLKVLYIQATPLKSKQLQTRVLHQHTGEFRAMTMTETVICETSALQLLQHPQLANHLQSLQRLSFVDCDVQDEEVEILCEFLWKRHQTVTCTTTDASLDHLVQHVSLRSNRYMSPRALQRLCQAPIVQSLDLCLCNIKDDGARAIALAFASSSSSNNNNNWRATAPPLASLFLAGNYQLDVAGFQALAHACPAKVRHLNLSYCDMNEPQFLATMKTLMKEVPSTPSILEELTLQGANMAYQEACNLLGQFLATTSRTIHPHLHTLRFQSAGDNPRPLSMDLLQPMVDGLQNNYMVRELQVDLLPGEVCDALEFVLLLNRAGRQRLLHYVDGEAVSSSSSDVWIPMLQNAQETGRLDVIYWLVRNSAAYWF